MKETAAPCDNGGFAMAYIEAYSYSNATSEVLSMDTAVMDTRKASKDVVVG